MTENIVESSSSLSAPPRRWLVRLASGFAILVVLFGMLGYFWLPGFAKAKLEEVLTAELKRPVSIESVDVSPYTLTAAVHGFKAGDVLSIGVLRVHVSGTSLFRGVPVVSGVTVEKPELHLVRVAPDRLNVSDIIEAFLAKPESPTPEFSVSNITVSGGRIDWVDQVAGGTQKVEGLTLGIPFVANIPSEVEVYVEPYFAAKINGAPFKLQGKLRPFAKDRDAEVVVALNGLDLTPVGRYVKLPVKLNGLRLDSQLKIAFRQPEGVAAVLDIEGDLALLGLDLDAGAQHVSIDRVDIKGIKVDPLAQRLAIAEISVAKPVAQLLRSKEGRFETGADGTGKSAGAKAAKAGQGGVNKASKPWVWAVGKVEIGDGAARYTDASVKEARPLEISGLALHVGAAESLGTGSIPVDLKAGLNQKGSLAVTGSAHLNGDAELNIDLQGLDLVTLQGWVAERLNVTLTKGDLGFKGVVKLVGGNAMVSGDVALGNFNVLDNQNATDLLRWKQLRLAALNVVSEPFSLAVGDIVLRDFYADILLNSDGHLNLKDIVRTPAAPAVSATTSSAVPAATVATPAEPTPMRFGSVTLSNGRIDFTDKFIKPNYSAHIVDLNGKVGALAAGKLSPVELRGKVDRTAPLEIIGKVDPFTSPIALDLRATARGIDLPSFSTYSGRYIGYAIEKGKLSVDVNYKIEKGELVAENKIFLDQLTFGQKVESKDALDLPVNLAIALLKNSRGEIDIELPVRGSLNDPQFSIGGIIFKVIVNLITKAVTAPFALIGSLFGGGEDISQVPFPSGDAAVGPDVESRLQSIAKAMVDRPGLKLEIVGVADSTMDKDGLKRAALNRKMRAQKLAEQAKRGKSGALEEVTLGPDETAVYLEKLYKAEDFPGKPRNMVGMAKSLPAAEMEALLLANIAAGDAELNALAEDRAERVQAWLTEKGVPVERMFLRSPKVEAGKDPKTAGGRAEFSLR